MSNGVDAAMQPAKPAGIQSGVDRIFPEPQLDQLSSRDDPMLSPGELANLMIGRSRLQFPAHMAGKRSLVPMVRRHAQTLTATGARVARWM
jgi:hypothetical protein